MNEIIDYFGGDELAASVWVKKYLDINDKTPDDMHKRMAKKLSEADQNYDKFNTELLSDIGQKLNYTFSEEFIYNYFKNFKYIVPQGSIMATLGTNKIATLSNCYVVESPTDSLNGIFKTIEEMSQMYKRRGGVGVDLSTLRPRNSRVNNAAKTSTGAVSFAEIISKTGSTIGAENRRAATMISIDISHPDAKEFIEVKTQLGKIDSANLSVKIDSDFWFCYENDLPYLQLWPKIENIKNINGIPENENIELNKLFDVVINDEISGYGCFINPKSIIKLIAESAWKSAEPGILYWDRIIDYSPDGVYPQYKPITTNPCGEIPISPGDSCRLIALNLVSFVDNPYKNNASFDFSKLEEISYIQMRLLDNIIDLEIIQVKKILAKLINEGLMGSVEYNMWTKVMQIAEEGRRTGSGITALADAAAACGIKYGSEEFYEFEEMVMHAKMRGEFKCTVDMAINRGTFFGWDNSKEFYTSDSLSHLIKPMNSFYEMLLNEFPDEIFKMQKYGRRNVSWSTISPTGTLSILTQTSSGVEPVFMPFYTRKVKLNSNESYPNPIIDEAGNKYKPFVVMHKPFSDWIKAQRNNADELTPEEIQKYYELSPWFGATANDLTPEQHIKAQSIAQKYTSHSISKTINLPETATVEDVENAYLMGKKFGLKGITLYRDGSRIGILSDDSATKKDIKFEDNNAIKRPKRVDAVVIPFKNFRENWIAIIGILNNRPYELFTVKAENLLSDISKGVIVKNIIDGKKQYDFEYNGGKIMENIGRIESEHLWDIQKLISAILRHGMPIHNVITTIESLTLRHDFVNTWKKGVVRALSKFVENVDVNDKCPVCSHNSIVMEEGCIRCTLCGWSKCS